MERGAAQTIQLFLKNEKHVEVIEVVNGFRPNYRVTSIGNQASHSVFSFQGVQPMQRFHVLMD